MSVFRRSPAERELTRQWKRNPTIRWARRHLLVMFLFTFGVLLLMTVLLSPPVTGWIWQSAAGEVSPAHDLLTGSLRWYWLLLIFSVGIFGVSIVLIGFYLTRAIRSWVSFCLTWKEDALPRLEECDSWGMAGPGEKACRQPLATETRNQHSSAALGYFACALLCFLTALCGGGMLVREQLPSLPGQAREDLAQLEAGSLQTAEVWLSPKTRSAHLPGPSWKGQPTLTTRYGAVGEDTAGQWIQLYVPDPLGFSLDQDRLYDETQTFAWNWAHAQRYQVRYTTNFHLVAEITPID